MPAAVPKSQEIAHELTNMLVEDITLDEMGLRRYLVAIEKLHSEDRFTKSYLKALAYASAEQKTDAIDWFEDSLTFPDEIKVTNYLSYIARRGSMREYSDLLFRIARCYEYRNFTFLAFNVCLYFGDISGMKEFSDKYQKLSNHEQFEEVAEHFSDKIKSIELFKSNTGLTDDDFNVLGKCVFSVVDKYSCKPYSVSFMNVAEEKSYSYIVGIKSIDFSLLVDMNIDLSFELAGHDQFLGKSFSAWFSSFNSPEVESNASN